MHDFERKKWILRLSVEQIALTAEFNDILQNIMQHLKRVKNDNSVTVDENLYHQIVLHVMGHHIRKEVKPMEYFPENLREPFVRLMAKDELCHQVFRQFALGIRRGAMVVSCSHRQASQRCRQRVQGIIQANLKAYISNVKQSSESAKDRVNEEILGCFVAATLLRRFTSLVHPCPRVLGVGAGIPGSGSGSGSGSGKGGVELHETYDRTHRLNVSTPRFEAASCKENGGVSSASRRNRTGTLKGIVEASIEDEATNISASFFSTDVERLCEKLQGHSLPESLRGHIWMFCCLHRAWGELPGGPSRTSELARLGAQRGIPIESFESSSIFKNTHSKMKISSARQHTAELARATLEEVFLQGFSIRLATSPPSRHRPCAADSEAPTPNSFLAMARAHYLSRQTRSEKSCAFVETAHGFSTQTDSNRGDTCGTVRRVDAERPLGSPRVPPLPVPCTGGSVDSSLLRRAEVLLHAEYVLTGNITRRGAAVALMTLIIFPDASPISENILRLFHHIQSECLPSEQMHHSYSIASTAKSAFSLLSREEPDMLAHMERVFGQGTDVVVAGSPRVPSSTLEPAPAIAASFVLLRPWLETGFIGYVSEFAVMFIWDQCFLLGGKAKDWRRLLPVVILTLLKILKDEILKESSVDGICRVLTVESKKIPTKALSMLLRPRLAALPRKKWFSSPFQDTSLSLDKIRAVVMLQKLGRGRADRKRVQDMLRAQQDANDAAAAVERAAVKDWQKEIERQAREWREEFMREKEDRQAVAGAVEHLVVTTMRTVGEVDQQREWESLQSEEHIDTDTDEEGEGRIARASSNGSVEQEMSVVSVEETREVTREVVERVVAGMCTSICERIAVEVREQCSLVLDGIITRAIEESSSERIRAKVEEQDQQDTSSVETSEAERGVIASLLADMVNTVSAEGRILESVELDPAITSPETEVLDIPGLQETTSSTAAIPAGMANELSEEELKSEEFRKTLPAVEVEALAGFFGDRRASLRVIRAEKVRLKGIISKYKRKFEKKFGHPPGWHERSQEIKMTYEDYQEISFSLKACQATLRDEEDALLRQWQQKKEARKSSILVSSARSAGGD